MYQQLQKDAFRDAKKIGVAADPSSYAGEKTTVAVVLDVESGQACYAPVQIVAASKMMSPVDHPDMTDRLKQLAYDGKLERTSAYHETQALSNAILKVTGRSLDQFAIPSAVLWKPVERGQIRFSQTVGHNVVPSVLDEAAREAKNAVPRGILLGDLAQLTACLDSGSVGRAGMSFAKNKLGLNVFVKWDKFHRLVRDLKLASEKACGGQMYRALLHMTFVMSLNSRPFGSGEWYFKKQEILAHYIDTHNSESESFVAFAHLIAVDHDMAYHGDGQDHERIFETLAELPSFKNKGATPKMMRWFSVNEMWDDRRREFWSLKLILQHASSSEDGPQAEVFDPASIREGNAKKELAALKAKHGGLSLAEKLITPWLRSRMKIYTAATRPSWTWYTEQVTTVKTPRDGKAHDLRQCCGGWQKELVAIVSTLTDQAQLAACDLMPHQTNVLGGKSDKVDCASVLLDFVVALVGNRAYSGSWFDCPPFCYAKVFSRVPEAKASTMQSMREDWKMITAFENTRHKNSVAADCFLDLQEVLPPPVRLMYLAFEQDQWLASSGCGRRILSCMLQGMPDSKIIEDTHQHLRDLERKGRSYVSSRVCRHRACVDSKQLETRGIKHKVVDKQHFVSNFGNKREPLAGEFAARKHIMSPDWYQLMEKRDWVSMSPESSRSSMACWRLCTLWQQSANPKPRLANAKASVVLPAGTVVQCSGTTAMCVGSTKWGGILCDLELLSTRYEQALPLSLWRLTGRVRWVHVATPSDWSVVPHKGCTPDQVQEFYYGVALGVYVMQTGQPVPILRHFLGERLKATYKELQDIFAAEGLGTDGRYRSRDELIRALAHHAYPDDEATAADVARKWNTTQTAESVYIDPLTEAAYDCLDKQEQQEFGDLSKQIDKAKKAGQLAKFRKDVKDRKYGVKSKKTGGAKKGIGKKGRGKGKGSKAPLESVGQPDAAPRRPAPSTPTAPAPSTPTAPSVAAASSSAAPSANRPGRDPDTFSWGSGSLCFDFTKRTNPNGWQIKCRLHEKQESLHQRAASAGELVCSRQMSQDALMKACPEVTEADANNVVLRQLKYWAICGERVSGATGRSEHMNPSLFKRYVPVASLPSELELDDQLAALAAKRRRT